MAKDQVEEIKQKVDILEIVGERVNLKKAGRHYKGLCPFHSEKSPSFMVSPERQSYKCFGCGEGGDVITFLQKYDGYSFLEALETLAKRVGVTLESYRPTAADSERKTLFSIMSLASEYYRYLLTEHKAGEEGREYLKKRGITSEASKLYGLGYAPNQWRSVSDFLIKKKGYSESQLERVGLMIRSEGGRYYDRFRGRVIFPLRDHKGAVVGFSGRTLSSDEKQAKYINSPETELYHKSKMLYGLWENREAIRKADSLVIVEGELDVLPSYQAGVKNVVAIKGSAFTDEMARLVTRYTKNVLMSLDADSAGQEAIKRAVQVAEPYELSIRVIQITGGKDPGDVATSDPKAWREMVKGAVLYYDFLIDSLSEKYSPDSGEGAKEISSEVVPALSRIDNMVVRAHYVSVLSKKLSVPEDSIYEEIERFRKKKELSGLKSLVKKIESGESAGRREKLQEYLLAMALQKNESLADKIKDIDFKVFEGAVKKIMEELSQTKGPFDVKQFANKLPSELIPTLDKAYLRDLSELSNIEKEWDKSLTELTEKYIRDRLNEISVEINKEERPGNDEKIAKLQAEFAELGKRLTRLQ